MKNLMLFVLAAALSLSGAEVRFPRQLLPRSNEIVIGDTHISVTRDTSVPSGWAVNASNGTETRKLPLNLGWVNRILFPGVILEMRNWNVSRNESWNIMAETIGEFEVRELTPAEVLKPGTAGVRKEKRRPGEVLILSNGMITLEVFPAVNGIVPCIRTEVTGSSLAHVGNLNRDLSLKDFTGVGFIELFDSYGNTPMAALNWTFENGILNLSGKSGAGKDLTLHRKMQLADHSFLFRIASGVTGTGKLPVVKHRPEIRLPGNFGVNALSMFLPENGRLYPRNVQSGTFTLNGNAYALGDKETGLMLGVFYRNASKLYLFVADGYMTLEAAGIIPKGQAVPPLTASYFFVHGLSRADFIGEGLLLAVPEKTPVGMIGNKLPLEFILGNAVPLNDAVLQLDILDGKGYVRSSQKEKLPVAAPGFASKIAVAAAVEKLKAGHYTVEVSVKESGKLCLIGMFPIQILFKEDLRKAKDFLNVLDRRIDAVRREYASAKEKRKIMKKFRRILLLKRQYQEALDAGDMRQSLELQKEAGKI